jgi:hypothetical protein
MICIAPVVRRTAITAVLAALALVASAACSNGGAEKGSAGANPTVATDPPTTTTTNPYDVPAVIDVAYVNRVLAGLDSVLGDVTRLLIRTNTFPPDAYDRLKALYGDNKWLQSKLDAFQHDLNRGFANYKPTPGNKVSTATRLIVASHDCIFVEVRRDYTPVAETPPPSSPQWVALKPLDRVRDPARYNNTGWSFVYDGAEPGSVQPPNPC